MSKTVHSTVPFQTPLGTALANGTLVLDLSQNASITSGGGQVVPKRISITLDGSGNAPNTTMLANDELTPSGTTYLASLYDSSGNFLGTLGKWSIAGASPIDLSQIVATTTGASYPGVVLLNPGANQTISSGNLAITNNEMIGGTLAVTGTSTLANVTTGAANNVKTGAVQQIANSFFSILDANGVSRFFLSNTSPYTNTFISAISGGFIFLGSAAKTFITDSTGVVTMSGATSGTTAIQASATASGTLTLPAATDTLVGKATTDTLTNKTLGGTTPFNRLRANQGSALVTGDVSGITNFGTTATCSAVTGTDSGGTVSISSSGTGQIADGTFTLTFHDGAWPAVPLVVAGRGDGVGPGSATVGCSATTTTILFSFNGVAIAGQTYIFNFICVGK